MHVTFLQAYRVNQPLCQSCADLYLKRLPFPVLVAVTTHRATRFCRGTFLHKSGPHDETSIFLFRADQEADCTDHWATGDRRFDLQRHLLIHNRGERLHEQLPSERNKYQEYVHPAAVPRSSHQQLQKPDQISEEVNASKRNNYAVGFNAALKPMLESLGA